MNVDDMLKAITPEIYANMRRSLELSKWPDGTPLTEEQKEITMQAIIAYEARNIGEEDRAGYIDRSKKSACGSGNSNKDDGKKDDGEQAVKWQDS